MRFELGCFTIGLVKTKNKRYSDEDLMEPNSNTALSYLDLLWNEAKDEKKRKKRESGRKRERKIRERERSQGALCVPPKLSLTAFRR